MARAHLPQSRGRSWSGSRTCSRSPGSGCRTWRASSHRTSRRSSWSAGRGRRRRRRPRRSRGCTPARASRCRACAASAPPAPAAAAQPAARRSMGGEGDARWLGLLAVKLGTLLNHGLKIGDPYGGCAPALWLPLLLALRMLFCTALLLIPQTPPQGMPGAWGSHTSSGACLCLQEALHLSFQPGCMSLPATHSSCAVERRACACAQQASCQAGPGAGWAAARACACGPRRMSCSRSRARFCMHPH